MGRRDGETHVAPPFVLLKIVPPIPTVITVSVSSAAIPHRCGSVLQSAPAALLVACSEDASGVWMVYFCPPHGVAKPNTTASGPNSKTLLLYRIVRSSKNVIAISRF